MGDLGNLDGFLKEGAVADLGWLDVDEEEYRKRDVLPKQNLDTQPDLQALWAREGESPTAYLVPNTTPVEPFPGAGTPHTMGDLSQEHGRLRAKAEEIRKVARLALIQSPDPRRFREALVRKFDLASLREHRQVLAEVLQERGLLGKLYIQASDFPGCHNGQASEFVHRFAAEARFVLAKPECSDCRHANGNNCAVFHKQLEIDVPYSDSLAEAVERSQAAKGKKVQASSVDPKERIRCAMLASSTATISDTYQGQGIGKGTPASSISPAVAEQQLIQASSLVRKNRAEKEASVQSHPVVEFLRREMVKGLSPSDLAKGLRLAFDQETLKKTQAHWAPWLKEAGLYGVIYSTQDSFSDCHAGADFFAKHNPGVRAIVAGSKCESCIYNKTRCLLYGKPLVRQASDLFTPETVEAVLLEHRTAGRLPAWDTKTASTWGSSPREALKAIHAAVSKAATPLPSAPARMDVMRAFAGAGLSHVTSGLTKREVLKQASRLMNEGLYGSDLLRALKTRFDPRDLVAARDDLRQVLAEQGLQGIYYVDPSAYDDYGRGCDEAARLHRSSLVEYAKVGTKCASCVLQTRVGFCSKLNKPLVVEPPYVDKTAQQREVLASGKATEVSVASLINNGASMLAEYQMQNGGLEVEVREATASAPVEIEIGRHKVDLK